MRFCKLLGGRWGKALLAVATIFFNGAVLADEVIPDFYNEPGLYPNRSYINQNLNEHVDPFTGGLSHQYVDLYLPGNGGFDLKVIRSYNSAGVAPYKQSVHESLAGLGWTVHFGRVLKNKENTICSNKNALSVIDNPVLELADGSRQTLAFTGNTSPLMLTSQRWRADCLGGGTGLAVYSPDGVRYDMTQVVMVGSMQAPAYAWYTTKITDRNGNYANVKYIANSAVEIDSVTTSDGRSVSFSYSDAGKDTRRISKISSAGQVFEYSYELATGLNKYQLTKVTRPDGTNWEYRYYPKVEPSAGGFLLKQVTYPQGGSVNYNYDFVVFETAANPVVKTPVVVSKSLSTGGQWSFKYSPGGSGSYDTTTINTPAGTEVYQHIGPSYTSSGSVWMAGLLVSKTIGSTQTETYTWDKQSISPENYLRPGAFVLKVDVGATYAPMLAKKEIRRDGATYTTSYSNFDSYGNPQSISESGPDGGNRTTTLSYYTDTTKWIIGKLKDESSSAGSVVRSFDSKGNLTGITRDGVTTNFGYDTEGNLSSTTFPRSQVHSYTNYKRGIAQSESQPESVSITRSVSDAGNITSETNGENNTTTYGYDGLNRVTSIAYPTGNRVSISYSASSKTATRGSLTESTTYDGFGRPNKVTLGGVARTYSYDEFGNKTFESNPGDSSGTRYSYDILSRVTRITSADGKSSSVAYSSNTKTFTDERGKSTVNTYRAYGDPNKEFLTKITAPDSSATVSIVRNNNDTISAITQNGVTRRYGYNGNNYLTSVSNPETGTTTYGRDAAGNMTTRSVGGSGTTSYTYDNQNRLTNVTYPGSTPAVTNTYNRTHKLVTSSNSAAVKNYSYNNNGNLTNESITIDGNNFTVKYDYNGNDQLSAITYPRSGRTVNYSPDELGRPTQVSGYVNSVNYWPSGQIKQINYINGTVSSYNQNSRLWPSSFSTQKSSTYYVNSNYTYDGVGNLTAISDASDNSYNRTLTYDDINRLATVSGPWGAGSIAYNGAGNITNQTFGGAGITYSYDSNNRLTSVSGARSSSYSYDNYGNISSGSNKTYSYDDVPNLRCVNCNDSSKKIEYTYDASNQRVSVSKAETKTYEVYSTQGNLLVEFTPKQADKLIEYIYLGGKRIAQRETSNSVASSTVLAASPNPVVEGKDVVLTATVNGSNPTGTVLFEDGAVSLGTVAVSSGKAVLTTKFTVVGNHLVSASYSGDVKNEGSYSEPLVLAVRPKDNNTRTSLEANPGSTGVNQTVVLTATISGGYNPAGKVSFSDGTTILGSADINAGKATLSTSFSVIGTHSLSATYAGDGENLASSSSPMAFVVTREANTVMTMLANPNPAGLNQAVLLSASINGNNPTGNVIFKDGAVVVGTAAISNGIATLTTKFTTLGEHALSASYAGDTNNKAINSNAVSLTVKPVMSSQTILTVSANPAIVNQPLTLTASVSGNNPTGTVVFKNGTTTLGSSVVNSGKATIVTTFTAVAAHSIVASYSGDALNTGSVSSAMSVSVINMIPTITRIIRNSADNIVVGETQSLYVEVAPAAGGGVWCAGSDNLCKTVGNVRFFDGDVVIGEAVVNKQFFGNTDARFDWTPTKQGLHVITAQYLGTGPNAASSEKISINVGPPVTTTTAWDYYTQKITDIPSGVLQKLTVSMTVSLGDGLKCNGESKCKTAGIVRFLDGTTVVGESSVEQYYDPNHINKLSLSRASIDWTPMTSGSRTITAQYLGTPPNLSSSVVKTINVQAPRATRMTWRRTPPQELKLGASANIEVGIETTSGGDLNCVGAPVICKTYGKVRFLDGETIIGESDVTELYQGIGNRAPRLASISWTPTWAGSHSIRAEYLGTAANAPSAISAISNIPGASITPPNHMAYLPAILHLLLN